MSVFNYFINLVNQVSGLLGLSHGGTNADLSATGGTSNVLKQTGVGSAVTVGQLAASDLSDGTTGSGAVVLASSPNLTGPMIISAASAGANICQITGTGVTAFPILGVRVDTIDASHPAIFADNFTNFAHSGDIITVQMHNGTDTGILLHMLNAGSGDYIDCDSAFKVAKSGTVGITSASPQLILHGTSGQDARIEFFSNGGTYAGTIEFVSGDDLYIVSDVSGKNIRLAPTGTGQVVIGGAGLQFPGSGSGSASIGVAAAAGTPGKLLLPITDPTVGQVLVAAAPSGGNAQTSWASSPGINLDGGQANSNYGGLTTINAGGA